MAVGPVGATAGQGLGSHRQPASSVRMRDAYSNRKLCGGLAAQRFGSAGSHAAAASTQEALKAGPPLLRTKRRGWRCVLQRVRWPRPGGRERQVETKAMTAHGAAVGPCAARRSIGQGGGGSRGKTGYGHSVQTLRAKLSRGRGDEREGLVPEGTQQAGGGGAHRKGGGDALGTCLG